VQVTLASERIVGIPQVWTRVIIRFPIEWN